MGGLYQPTGPDFLQNYLTAKDASRERQRQDVADGMAVTQFNQGQEQRNALQNLDPAKASPQQLMQAGLHEQAFVKVKQSVDEGKALMQKMLEPLRAVRDGGYDQALYEGALQKAAMLPGWEYVRDKIPAKADPKIIDATIGGLEMTLNTAPDWTLQKDIKQGDQIISGFLDTNPQSKTYGSIMPFAQAPAVQAQPTELQRMMAERDALPPGDPRRGAYDAAINKQTTHAPAAQQNNFGTNFTPAIDKDGNPVLLQPSKGGGQPNVVQGYMPSDDAMKYRDSGIKAKAMTSKLDTLNKDIDEVIQHKGLGYAVGVASVLPGIPGTVQADAIASIENLQSRAAVAAINEMREMSKTGGAVGQVTEAEWPKLENQLANLKRAQSRGQFVRELKKFKNQVNETKRLIANAQAQMPKVSGTAAPQAARPPLDSFRR